MFTSYARFGEVEIINTERARGYAATADCPVAWIKATRCETLKDALGDDEAEYTYGQIASAPWFDTANPEVSGRFLGVVGIDFIGLYDSTRQVSLTEGLTDGGLFGASRRASKSVRVRVQLLAIGDDALEYGVAWLTAALDGDRCGQHGARCGVSDFEFMVACPPELETDPETGEPTPEMIAAWEEALRANKRFMHDVAVTNGPMVTEQHRSGQAVGALVEFTIASERGYVYGAPKSIELLVGSPRLVQDIEFNLATYPSAELQGDPIEVRRNYHVNPSLEVDAAEWTFQRLTGTGGAMSGGRVVGEAALFGTASYLVEVKDIATSSDWLIRGYTGVTYPSGLEQLTIGMWALAYDANGGGNPMTVELVTGSTSPGPGNPADPTGNWMVTTVPANPAGDTLVISAWSRFTALPGSDYRLYLDACLVTSP